MFYSVEALAQVVTGDSCSRFVKPVRFSQRPIVSKTLDPAGSFEVGFLLVVWVELDLVGQVFWLQLEFILVYRSQLLESKGKWKVCQEGFLPTFSLFLSLHATKYAAADNDACGARFFQ